MAAVAMLNSRTVNGLEKQPAALEQEVQEGAAQLQQAEEKFRTLVENLPDVVARFDPELRHLYVSPSVRTCTGRPPRGVPGQDEPRAGHAARAGREWDAALRGSSRPGEPERLEFAIPGPQGTRHFDCRLVPERGDRAARSVRADRRPRRDRALARVRGRAARPGRRRSAARGDRGAHPQPRPRDGAGDAARPPAPAWSRSTAPASCCSRRRRGSPSARSSTATASSPCRPRSGRSSMPPTTRSSRAS